ncbi:Vacuolar protein-sorting-associated protein 36 [Orobanche minor]
MMKPDALLTGVSASDAAMTLGVAPAMAKEYLLAAEGKGLLCRDVSPDGYRFYINLFLELNPGDIYPIYDVICGYHNRCSLNIT